MCIHVHMNTFKQRNYSEWWQNENQYIIKGEREGNEGWCCEPVPFSTNGHAVVSNWISGNRLRPTYSVCKIPYVVSWCTFLLNDFALTSRSADINAKSFRWNSSSILHGVGQSIIKTYLMRKTTTFYINIACSYHFITTTQKDFVSFLYLCTQIRQRNKRNKKNPIRNETLYAHNITIIRSELSTLWAE